MSAMAFPCRPEAGAGRFRPLSGQEEIAQSVRMILSTRQGERPFRPRFGTRLDQYAFEIMDTTICNLIRQEVVAALQTWEPRIWNIRVNFEHHPEDGRLLVLLSYQIRQSGTSVSQTVSLPEN